MYQPSVPIKGACAFSPDDKIVVTGGDDATAAQDTASGRQLGEVMETYHLPGAAVAFSPDGKVVMTGSDDATARFWDAATRR